MHVWRAADEEERRGKGKDTTKTRQTAKRERGEERRVEEGRASTPQRRVNGALASVMFGTKCTKKEEEQEPHSDRTAHTRTTETGQQDRTHRAT